MKRIKFLPTTYKTKIFSNHEVSGYIMILKNSHKLDSYLYKSWNNTCPDYTKSSIEDLDCCQDLAEEHHIRHGVKGVVERI